MNLLVTGSGGLIGSEAVRYFSQRGYHVHGIDNDMRSHFFGKDASTKWNVEKLKREIKDYEHFSFDIRDKTVMEQLFKTTRFDLIIHTAAQPSHDWAAKDPFTDFEVNANGTLNALENFRRYSPNGVFIFTSTNKVYGDTPNRLPLIEEEKRWEIDPSHRYRKGIDEIMSIDDSKHSLFGVSKAAADLMVQEYGKYYSLHTGVFRGGCLTGPAHSAAELHGFLAYLVQCINSEKEYTIFGYKGKQVRDNIHAHDLITAFDHFSHNPKNGEVYNMGGSRHSNISMLEAIDKIQDLTGKKANVKYSEKAREGDHQWYITDVSKFKRDFPDWDFTYDIDAILEEMCESVKR
ncbi:NAD-dependent epimerase [Candidatus Pacearchaeota archaeon CG10_big_fil_rev_8_21_14_0_10_32_14]|nr:MAG: NAD-dependent epimerase [Candidatus Pacearchaeota archaeon CG10_big_fil_rev_8_21_14_0_10_32_14]